MSLDVALQSVAFYVLSCSTCSKIKHRRKAKQQAKKEREERKLETEEPGLYRHPSPFSTNPFWGEEIMLGPGPPKRKGDKNGSKNGSSRALNTAGPGSSVVSGTTSTDAGSSPTMVAADHRISGENWNRKRYQREDEVLWGQIIPHTAQHTGQKFMDALARAGNSVGITDRILGGRLSKIGGSKGEGEGEEEQKEETGSYYIARNPPLNELHPPVVSSQPTHKGAMKWMMQPPPPAKVMEGKERANRSRSDSGASSRRGADDTNLGRQVSSRVVEAKLKRGETPDGELSSFSLSDPISKPKAAVTRSRDRQDRKVSSSTDSSDSSESAIKRKQRPPPISISPPRKTKDKAEHIPIPTMPSEVSTTFRLAPGSRDITSRPALATIASSSASIPQTNANLSPTPQDLQPSQSSEDSPLKNSIDPPKKSPKVYPVVIPKVYHSFQGKDTFVFPPRPSESKHKENERTDYDADCEDEESRERSTERGESLEV